MKKDRLLRLASLLECSADKTEAGENIPRFDLGVWGIQDRKSVWDKLRANHNACRTTACAVGLACVSGVFADEGLSHSWSGNAMSPSFDGFGGWNAVQSFFDLEPDDAHYLFAGVSYDYQDRDGPRGERAVAARIKELVAEQV